MLCNDSEMSLIFCQTLSSLVLGWAPNYFVLGAQFAPGEMKKSQKAMLIRSPPPCIVRVSEKNFWQVIVPTSRP